jgi:hypothetical protein
MEHKLALLSTGTGGTILAVLVLLYKTFNHKRFRSNCCGKKLEMSLDVEDTHENPLRAQQVGPGAV